MRTPILSEWLFHPKAKFFVSVATMRPSLQQEVSMFVWYARPGFCTGAKDDTMRSLSEGEQGWALLPPTLWYEAAAVTCCWDNGSMIIG